MKIAFNNFILDNNRKEDVLKLYTEKIYYPIQVILTNFPVSIQSNVTNNLTPLLINPEVP